MSNKAVAEEQISNHVATTTTTIGVDQDSARFSAEDIQTIKAKKMDFNKQELLRLLCYMEGELQARDVVIAVLKSEKVKNLVNLAAYGAPSDIVKLNDPHAALLRDSLAQTGNLASRQTSAIAAQSERDARDLCEQQLLMLSQKVDQQRMTHSKVVGLLKLTRDRHLKLMQELDDERHKNEVDVAPGTSSAERSRIQKKLTEAEAMRDALELEVKKLKEGLDAERSEHKDIVIYLMEERKKINSIRNEERKRSEDLAQILSEEKLRVDSIAEGLEEETKKSLRLEAEMEKQSQCHEQERKTLLRNMALEEKKVRDLETEVTRLRMDNEALKKSTAGVAVGGANPMMSSVAKVIQPTATVSSVPVSGPTTGIARSISPGQIMRQDANASNVATIIRAHSVQSQPPQPPVKKSQLTNAGQRVPPPIPPNKPIINKGAASVAAATANANTRIAFLSQQATVPGVSSAAQAIAAQNAKEGGGADE